MADFCPNCGAKLKEGARFCESCGASIPAEEANTAANDSYDDYDYKDNDYQKEDAGYASGYASGASVAPRNIAVCIILSLITCGIYALYWMYVLNEDVSAVAGEEPQTSGGLVILFSIITCGIYMWYWLYKEGELVSNIKVKNGSAAGSDAVVFLILAIFGLSIVDLALMQDAVNKYGA
ncbi:MAG: DUF4234 domain-containing protein [Lachnospiraceae bacterium]|nr:DUF4234 domain-containing protein [Lachnospiraceae bacterium]